MSPSYRRSRDAPELCAQVRTLPRAVTAEGGTAEGYTAEGAVPRGAVGPCDMDNTSRSALHAMRGSALRAVPSGRRLAAIADSLLAGVLAMLRNLPWHTLRGYWEP
jgi:hypothetical protein